MIDARATGEFRRHPDAGVEYIVHDLGLDTQGIDTVVEGRLIGGIFNGGVVAQPVLMPQPAQGMSRRAVLPKKNSGIEIEFGRLPPAQTVEIGHHPGRKSAVWIDAIAIDCGGESGVAFKQRAEFAHRRGIGVKVQKIALDHVARLGLHEAAAHTGSALEFSHRTDLRCNIGHAARRAGKILATVIVRQDGDAAGRINPPHAGRRNGKEIGKDGIVVHRQSVTDVQIARRIRHGRPTARVLRCAV